MQASAGLPVGARPRGSAGASGRGRLPILGGMIVLCLTTGCGPGGGGPGEIVQRDGLGRSVRVPGHPARIVSLAPSVTAALVALGATERLVGVSDFCRLPPGATSIARVGGMLNPSLETIRGLRPDLLIATTSGNDPSLARQAETLGLPLYTIDTPDVERVLLALQDLSRLLGTETRGSQLVGELRARLESVHSRLAGRRRPRTLFIVWGDPLVVPGRSAFLTDALERAGADSVTADAPTAWPAFDVESAIARAPEVILTTPQNAGVLDRLRGDAAWARVPALVAGRLLVVGEDIQQPGPEVVTGIEEVARALHADAFAGDMPERVRPPHDATQKKAVRAEARTAGESGMAPVCPPQCENSPTPARDGTGGAATSGASMQHGRRARMSFPRSPEVTEWGFSRDGSRTTARPWPALRRDSSPVTSS